MRVLVTDPIAQAGIDILRKHAEVDMREGLTADELHSIIGEYEVLIVRSQTKVTAAVIDAADI